MVIHSHTTVVVLSLSENDGHAPEPGDGGGGVAATAHSVTTNDNRSISFFFRILEVAKRIVSMRHDKRMNLVTINDSRFMRLRVLQANTTPLI
jgi:hypothetical protein